MWNFKGLLLDTYLWKVQNWTKVLNMYTRVVGGVLMELRSFQVLIRNSESGICSHHFIQIIWPPIWNSEIEIICLRCPSEWGETFVVSVSSFILEKTYLGVFIFLLSFQIFLLKISPMSFSDSVKLLAGVP